MKTGLSKFFGTTGVLSPAVGTPLQEKRTASFLYFPGQGSPKTVLLAATEQEALLRHKALTLSAELWAWQELVAKLGHEPVGVP
jgi:hypothetical protein